MQSDLPGVLGSSSRGHVEYPFEPHAASFAQLRDAFPDLSELVDSSPLLKTRKFPFVVGATPLMSKLPFSMMTASIEAASAPSGADTQNEGI